MTANAQTPVSDRIVVGVDGSESSMQALRWARYLAGVTGAHRRVALDRRQR